MGVNALYLLNFYTEPNNNQQTTRNQHSDVILG